MNDYCPEHDACGVPCVDIVEWAGEWRWMQRVECPECDWFDWRIAHRAYKTEQGTWAWHTGWRVQPRPAVPA